MASFDQSLNILKTATDYPSVSTALREVLNACPSNQLENFKLKVATVLREKQAAEGRAAQKHPRALQEIDLKYKNLVNILSSHTPQTQPPPSSASPPVEKPSSIAKAPTSSFGLGSMLFQNFFQSKKKLIVGFGAGLGAIAGLAFVYSKFSKPSEPAKNPEDFKTKKLEGFEKTLAALQRLRSLNKISKTGSWDDYEGYLSGKKKKGEPTKELKKLIDWNKEENSLMSSADRAMKALANFKLSSPDLPLLSDFGSSSMSEIPFDEGKKKRKRKEKKEEFEASEEMPIEEVAEEIQEMEPEPILEEPEPEETGRLIPVVKRNKRIKKIF